MNKNLLRLSFITAIFLISSTDIIAQNRKVNITDFSLTTKENNVIIDWKTDGATTTNYFAIQKSTDGINYKTVALVLGPDPKQNNSDSYGCMDKFVHKFAKNYYRLVHIDTDGNEQIEEAKILSKP